MINKENVHLFAADNHEMIAWPVRGLILEFPGLDGGSCLGGQTHVGPLRSGYAVRCARRGLLLVYPFVGPWSWMNDAAVRTVDMVVDAVKEKYGLGDVPMVNTGGSMGGAGALMYTADGKHRACACAVSGPACDLLSMTEDFPDGMCTVYRAVAHYDMPFEDAVKRISPLYQLDRLPEIPYFVAHTDADEIIRIEKNAEPLVAGLRARGHDVTYMVVPGQAHCDIGPEAQLEFDRFVFAHGGGREV